MNTKEKLSFFMELINCNYDLFYWNYDANFKLIETDWFKNLFSGAFFDYIGFHDMIRKHLQNGNHYPLLLEAEFNLLWIAGFEFEHHTLTNIYMIGPILSGRDSHMILRKRLNSYNLSVGLSHSVHKTFESIPAISSNTLMQYAVMLHYCLNHEKITMNDIQLQSTMPTDQKVSSYSSNSHAGIWFNEQLFCKMLSEGNPQYKEAIQKSFSLSHGVRADIGDALRYHKNNFIVLLTLCSRACIQGGLSPDIAYDLNDYYAEKAEQCNSMANLQKLCDEMMQDYVKRVQDVRKNTSISKPIRNSCEYINSHLSESISIEYLAKRAGYTEYYFSHKFKKEMNCSVNDYIIARKIEQAKLMLQSSTQSISEISDSLSFGNRSYFYTCFRKITGMSPSEYRAKLPS